MTADSRADDLLSGLNPRQREAVVHTGSPLLIVAGAGSGKTTVLTRRIAYLLQNRGVAPWQILAITFTNKAAAEMRERVEDLVGPRAKAMWVMTFHSACVRILRRDAAAAGLKSSFTIYDSADSLRQDLADYLSEESRMLVGQAEAQARFDELDDMKLALDRLEARIERLALNLNPDRSE